MLDFTTYLGKVVKVVKSPECSVYLHHPAGHHRAGGGYQLGHAPDRYPQGLRVFAAASGPEAHHEGQPRLLVEHGQQNERLSESGGLRYPAHPAQQLLHGGGLRPLRHTGLAVRCGGAA